MNFANRIFLIFTIFLLSFFTNTQEQTIKFSHDSGFYPNEFELTLSVSDNSKIFYTIDSTNPTNSSTSMEYSKPIAIKDRTSEPNVYSAIVEDENSPVSISRGNNFKEPVYLVDKAMVIRAVAKNSQGEFTSIVDKTYFITTGDLKQYEDLTIVSLVTSPPNLFDPDYGIYVTGNMYQNWKKSPDYNPGQNPWDKNGICNYYMRGSEWEREASVTFFEKGKILIEQNIGIRLKGASTRNNPGKSFNLLAKKKYGKATFDYPILPDNYDIDGKLISSYKSISLRSVYEETRARDKFAIEIINSRKDLATTNMRDAVLFLDGEYWGYYMIQEKLDNEFMENNYHVPRDDVAMIKEVENEEGPQEETDAFINFCDSYSKKDLSDSKNYEDIQNFIDIDSMIEHFTVGIYLGITDWPGQNEGQWRNFGNKIEGNKYGDGKWRFMTYDMDYTMGAGWGGTGPEVDNFQKIEQRQLLSPANLFVALFKNEEFSKRFSIIFCDYANEVMNVDKIKEMVVIYKEECSDLVGYSQLRWWGATSKLEGFSHWKSNYQQSLDNIQRFFENRSKYALQHMKNHLNIKGNLNKLTINVEGNGEIKVNTIIPTLKNGSWTGQYYSDIPITLSVVSSDTFKGWTGDVESSEKTIEINLTKDMNIKANFQ